MISYDQNNKRVNLSIDTLDDILRAKSKGKSLIESCITNKQLDVAKRFVGLYMESTQDLIGASEMEIEILYKRKEVEDNVFGKKHWNKLIKELKNV
tara:strand:+ start:713 stop:1000 length:288 start_codon:yes stop_codon:yes gene_type:complete